MKFVLGLVLLGISVPSISQNIKTLNDSAQFHFEHNDFDRSFSVASSAYRLAEQEEAEEELYRSACLLANISFRQGQFRQAQKFNNESISIAVKAGRLDWRAKSMSNMASTLINLGEYDSAETLLQEIINLKEVPEEVLMATYGRLGVNRKKQQQYDKAIEYYIKSLDISMKRQDSLASARTLANIGNIYMEQQDIRTALDHYLQALALLDSSRHALSFSGISVFVSDAYQAVGEYDKAEQILKSSLRIIDRLNLLASKSYALESLGILYFNRNQLDDAIKTLTEALALERSMDSFANLESILMHLGQCYIKKRQYEKARDVLEEGLSIAKTHRHGIGLQNIYLHLSSLDSARGDYKNAWANYKRSTHYKDSLFTVEKALAVEEVSKKFETQQKIKIIEEQKHIIEQERAKVLFFSMLVGIIVVASILIFILTKRKNRIKLQMQQEVQQKQQLLAIVIAQEQMQQKIARDLHDSLVQILGAAKIKLESGKPLVDSKAVAEAVEIIDRACVDARNISHQLLPYSLEKHGLIIALQELIEKQPKRDGEEFQFSYATEASRFPQNIEINTYRIVQELIHNSIKHSGANEVKVHLSQKNGTMKLSVIDNGRGFNPSTVLRGAGLMNIESRLNSMHGTMRIVSAETEGTTTVIEIPL